MTTVVKMYAEITVCGPDGETYGQLMARFNQAMNSVDVEYGGVLSEILPGTSADAATEPDMETQYVEIFECSAPPTGTRYVVLEDEWARPVDNVVARVIQKIRLIS